MDIVVTPLMSTNRCLNKKKNLNWWRVYKNIGGKDKIQFITVTIIFDVSREKQNIIKLLSILYQRNHRKK